MSGLPVVAIVGRPNVGKSTLFNRIVGRRLSVVHEAPGVTRDRIYAQASWNGVDFAVADTGGMVHETGEELARETTVQALIATEEAAIILFMVDARDGVTPADQEVAQVLRKSGKPILVVANKIDNAEMESLAVEFAELGFATVTGVSAVHGYGVADLLDRTVASMPKGAVGEVKPSPIKLAVVGRPNVGKSSLVNAFLNRPRVIVNQIPGTTRDAIDVLFRLGGKEFIIIDTPGLRRKATIREDVERYSVQRALHAVERADVAILMLDATQGIVEQDCKIAGFVKDEGKGAVVVFNKWDLVEGRTEKFKELSEALYDKVPFMRHVPMLTVSALTRQRVAKILTAAELVWSEAQKRIETPELNRYLEKLSMEHKPPTRKAKMARIYYAAQVGVAPPTFVLFVNDKSLMHFSYMRYLENKLREKYGFLGVPLRFALREK